MIQSAKDKLSVDIFTCPWKKQWVGASSNVGLAVQLGQNTLEFVGNKLSLNGAVVSRRRKLRDIEVLVTRKTFTILGPASAAGRVKIQVSRRAMPVANIPSGYILNIFAKLPAGSSALSTGLCRGAKGGSSRIQAQETLFSKKGLEMLNKQCFKMTGVSMADFRPIDDAATLCKQNGHDIKKAEAKCAKDRAIRALDLRQACIFDYCAVALEAVIDDVADEQALENMNFDRPTQGPSPAPAPPAVAPVASVTDAVDDSCHYKTMGPGTSCRDAKLKTAEGASVLNGVTLSQCQEACSSQPFDQCTGIDYRADGEPNCRIWRKHTEYVDAIHAKIWNVVNPYQCFMRSCWTFQPR